MSIFKNVEKKAMPEFRIFHTPGSNCGRSEQCQWGSSAQRAASGISGDIYIFINTKKIMIFVVSGGTSRKMKPPTQYLKILCSKKWVN